MRTDHVTCVADARSLPLPDDAVDLVVTSPPYPMIEQWDDLFEGLAPEAAAALEVGDGDRAFEAMHDALSPAWSELERVLRPGGIACINVGDATRSVGGRFQRFPNNVAVTDRMREAGFRPLPDILWRKPVNRLTKFMGSGMLPPNAYPTLEHEYLLVFRNGDRRAFEPHSPRRYESAYFWEERNRWFSDLWTDVRGVDQTLDGEARERSGAYPVPIPFRLISMFSVYGDRVLDPFWGTGTTTLAAMAAGRNSVGVEVDPSLVAAFEERARAAPRLSREVADERLDAHRRFLEERRAEGEEPDYDAEHYGFPVVTAQERDLRLYAVERVQRTAGGYVADHEPV